MLRRMTARGIAPDTILLNQLLESLVRASRPAQAARPSQPFTQLVGESVD